MTAISRKVAHVFAQLLKNKGEFNNVVLVEGARQVGKTTLIRQVLTESRIPFKEFNLEEEKALAEKIDRCADFAEFAELVAVTMRFQVGDDEVLFIDEAQESKGLGSFVRFMKEKWAKTQVILSGSSMARIFRGDVRYPVGRVTILHLQPFSFEEFLEAAGEKTLLDRARMFSVSDEITENSHARLLELLEQYMDVGGLPEVVTTFFKKGDWSGLRENLLLGYYNDFRRVYGEGRQAYFVAVLKTAAHLLGSPFKNSHVANLLDDGKNKEIIQAMSQLEAWRILLKVDQCGSAVETHFHPKRYLFDTGIAKHLRETVVPRIHLLRTLDAALRTALGGLMENVVANVLVSFGSELAGWKKGSSGSEIDFVLKREGRAVPVECKAALAVKNSHLGGVVDFLHVHKVPVGVVIALAPFEVRQLPDRRHIIIVPLYLVERLDQILQGDL